MTDLGDFGVDVPGVDSSEESPEKAPPDTAEPDSSGRCYRNGRCPAIAVGHRGRCQGPTSRMNTAAPFCGTHGRQNDPWTIHDDPETLILLTGRLDAFSLEDLDPDAVDFDRDRIIQAVHAVHGLEYESLAISEDGLWLPWRHRTASRLIIRTPTATIDSTLRGDDPAPRSVPFASARVGHYDPDYLDGEGRTAEFRNPECLPDGGPPRVGLKIAGEDQESYPVSIEARGSGGDPA